MTFNYPAVANQIFTIESGAQVTVTLTFYDFPSFPENTFNNSIPGGSQNVNVTNAPLTVSLPIPYSTNNGVYNVNLFGNSVSTSLAAGTAGKITYVVGFDLAVSENATLAVAGENVFTIGTSQSYVIAKHNIWLPAVALTTGFSSKILSQRFAFPMLPSLGIQPTVELLSAAALATGHYNCNLYLVDM
jgi:hypothetical protein